MQTLSTTKSGSLAMPAATVSAAIDSQQSAPSANTDGISTSGYSQLAVGVHSLDNVTAWTCELWVYDGDTWMQALDSSGAAIEISGTTGTGAQVFNIAGFERAFWRLSAITTTGTGLKTSQRAIGPGL